MCVCVYAHMCANFLPRKYSLGNPNLVHFHTYRGGTISSNLTYIINMHYTSSFNSYAYKIQLGSIDILSM